MGVGAIKLCWVGKCMDVCGKAPRRCRACRCRACEAGRREERPNGWGAVQCSRGGRVASEGASAQTPCTFLCVEFFTSNGRAREGCAHTQQTNQCENVRYSITLCRSARVLLSRRLLPLLEILPRALQRLQQFRLLRRELLPLRGQWRRRGCSGGRRRIARRRRWWSSVRDDTGEGCLLG